MTPLIKKLDELSEKATQGEWKTPKETGVPHSNQCPVDHEGCEIWPWNHERDMIFAYALVNAYRWELREYITSLEKQVEAGRKLAEGMKKLHSTNWIKDSMGKSILVGWKLGCDDLLAAYEEEMK